MNVVLVEGRCYVNRLCTSTCSTEVYFAPNQADFPCSLLFVYTRVSATQQKKRSRYIVFDARNKRSRYSSTGSEWACKSYLASVYEYDSGVRREIILACWIAWRAGSPGVLKCQEKILPAVHTCGYQDLDPNVAWGIYPPFAKVTNIVRLYEVVVLIPRGVCSRQLNSTVQGTQSRWQARWQVPGSN